MKAYTSSDFQADMRGPEPRREELAYLQARLEPSDGLLVQSLPLTGTIFTEQGPMEVDAAIAAFEVGTVVYRFGTWAVTEDGIACLVHRYPLTHALLQAQQDWASHLAEQSWVNLWDLLRALAVAQHTRSRQEQHGPYGNPTSPS
jgi:hypothetical protein